MFSSNPFPQLPSSILIFSPPSSYLHHKKHDAYFNKNNPFISGDCFHHAYNNIAAPPPVMENITTIKQDFVRQQQFSEGSGLQYCEDHDDLLESVITHSKKKMVTSKKDGYDKINTARGPRDRRVRLSVEIAKKLFCLQDLLGFKKASKTLDWLFTKSKTAIKDLVEETKHSSSGSSTVTEVKFLETITGGFDEEKEQKKKRVDGKRKKMTRKSKAGFQANLAKDQLRAEARARARERTREKMLIKKHDDEYLKTLVLDDYDCQVSPSNMTLQSSCWSQIQSQCDYEDMTWEST